MRTAKLIGVVEGPDLGGGPSAAACHLCDASNTSALAATSHCWNDSGSPPYGDTAGAPESEVGAGGGGQGI